MRKTKIVCTIGPASSSPEVLRKMCLAGKGVFDFDTLIKRLQDVGFNGALLIEAYAGDYERQEELKTACDYLQELLYKHNAND